MDGNFIAKADISNAHTEMYMQSREDCKIYIYKIFRWFIPVAYTIISIKIRRWVKNYPQCRYMFCSWLYCWLGM